MGVNIPDNDFSYVDVLRELERVRENLAGKDKVNENNKTIDDNGDDILVTNGLGKSIPVNLTWLDQEEVLHDQISLGKNKKKPKKNLW